MLNRAIIFSLHLCIRKLWLDHHNVPSCRHPLALHQAQSFIRRVLLTPWLWRGGRVLAILVICAEGFQHCLDPIADHWSGDSSCTDSTTSCPFSNPSCIGDQPIRILIIWDCICQRTPTKGQSDHQNAPTHNHSVVTLPDSTSIRTI